MTEQLALTGNTKPPELVTLLAGSERAQLPKIAKNAYHSDRSAVSKSVLDEIDLSPAHARAYLDGLKPWRYAKALDVGDAAHAMILQPDDVRSMFLHPPRRLDRRKNPDKGIWADLEVEAAHTGRVLLKYDDYQTALSVRDAVYKHKQARAILGKGEPEQTFLWRDPKTGEMCKCRPDWTRPYFLTDLKTTTDASPEAFGRSAHFYRYDVQDAHYTSGVDPDIGFVFVVAETAPPFGVAVYADYPAMRRLGLEKRDRNLGTYAECKSSGVWPGYTEEIQVLRLPQWAFRNA